MDPSAATEAVVRQFGVDLDRDHPAIERCQVFVEQLRANDSKRPRHFVRIEIVTANGDLSVTRDSLGDPLYGDVHSIVGAAFAAAAFQLDAAA